MIMATVCLAAIKIGNVMFDLKPMETHHQLSVGIGITSVAWFIVTLLTQPTSQKQLQQFCIKIKPAGPGWKKVIEVGS